MPVVVGIDVEVHKSLVDVSQVHGLALHGLVEFYYNLAILVDVLDLNSQKCLILVLGCFIDFYLFKNFLSLVFCFNVEFYAESLYQT